MHFENLTRGPEIEQTPVTKREKVGILTEKIHKRVMEADVNSVATPLLMHNIKPLYNLNKLVILKFTPVQLS